MAREWVLCSRGGAAAAAAAASADATNFVAAAAKAAASAAQLIDAAAPAGVVAGPSIYILREVVNENELSDSDKAFGQGITFITSILASVLLSVVMTASPPEGSDRISKQAWPILGVLAVLCSFFSMMSSILMQTKGIPKCMFYVAVVFLVSALDLALAALVCYTDGAFPTAVRNASACMCSVFVLFNTGFATYYCVERLSPNFWIRCWSAVCCCRK